MLLNAAYLLEVAFAFYIFLAPSKAHLRTLQNKYLERSDKVCQYMALVSLHLFRNL